MVEQSVEAPIPAIAAWRAGLAWMLCWLDRRAEASGVLEQAASDRFEHIPPDPTQLTALALYADAAVADLSQDAAAILYGSWSRGPTSSSGTASAATGTCACGSACSRRVMGEDEQADEHLAFACEFHEANGLPLWAARGHLGWAEALAARGDMPRRASTPPARSSSRASTATGFSSRARRRSSRRGQPPRSDRR